MKKILSVALSTAMAFSMFASVAFGQTGLTDVNAQYNYLKDKGIFSGFPDGQAHLDRQMTRAEFAKVITKTLGLKEVEGVYSFKDKNYGENHWAAPYVEAVYAAGIMEGVNSTKKIFGVSNPVTIQEMATVLVRALDLEVPTETNNSATAWAKGYVQAAINAGLVDANANFQSNATRELLVGAAYAVDQELSLSVESYTVIEDGKAVEFKMTDGETVKVTLDTALEANKETEVKFTYQEKEFTEKVTYVVTTATKLNTVSADNLREVKVAFDGEVEAATAEDTSNYALEGEGNPEVIKASLSADKKTVTLTVESATNANGALSNQKEYTLDVTNVRAGGKVITANDVKFTPVDAALPVANSVQALGNKAVKVVFSEPVSETGLTANNFKIDGQSVVGTVDVTGNTVVLKVYTALSTGEHTATVQGVKDYSGLASLATDLKFSVVEDNQAPTVANVEKATFEEVVLKFSETVDPTTVSPSNVYWNEGTTKRYADTVEAVSDDTYKFTFAEGNKLKYATSLYVTGVADYSGNVIKSDTTVSVNPVIDQTRPEVISVKMADNSNTDFVVKFTKSVITEAGSNSALNQANYVIKDSEGKEVAQFKNVTPVEGSDNKSFNVHLYNALSEGKSYTLTISNVADTTTLNNVLLPYSTTIEIGDNTPPALEGASLSTTTGRVVVTYNEAMATSGTGSILEKGNYIYYAGGTVAEDESLSGGEWKQLPSGASIIASSDAKSAIIIFPSNFDTETVKAIRVTGVKDVAGKTIQGLVDQAVVGNITALRATEDAEATATNKIKVKFNTSIQAGSASTSDFDVRDGANTKLSVVSAAVDGSSVILTLSDSYKLNADAERNGAVTVKVLANKNLVTPAGTKAEESTVSVVDKIAPSIKEVAREVVDGSITVEFTEEVVLNEGAANDFEVLVDGKVIAPGATGFTVSQDPANDALVRVELAPEVVSANAGKVVQIKIKNNPVYITDGENTVASSSVFSAYIPSN